MLLNERAVLRLGAEEGRRWRPKMEGKLWLRGESGRWEGRWGELRGNLLHLWVKRGIEGAGVALVVVEDAVVELAEEEEGRDTAFRLRFLSTNRMLGLAAESVDQMEAWVAALASASTDHARLILASLAELHPPPSSNPPSSNPPSSNPPQGPTSSSEEPSPPVETQPEPSNPSTQECSDDQS